MKYVYLIRSVSHPVERYVGLTSVVAKRIEAHNAVRSIHTAKFRPWSLVSYFAFENEDRAVEFEKYLKSGSCRAFANRPLW
ncbi:MAG: GIY-YIG nuclease family protein [Proteobacteria bacterium]|nr:GIY-YIG nuclease family protein [Pseudomonadota bacterium]